MVDTGATSHIIKDIDGLKNFDESFQPDNHFIELTVRRNTNGVALKWSNADICQVNMNGNKMSVTWKGALFVPSYPQDIFSVKSAAANGAAITFKKNKNELIHKNITKFNIFVHNRLYYLMSTTNNSEDSCHGCYDINTWHRILDHCNYDDIRKFPNVVKGMKIKEKIGTLNKNYEICIQGKFSQCRNRQPDRRAASTFELIHTDLAGPIEPADINRHRYAITFTDDFSSAIFVYFLKTKKDIVSATKKFIADTALHGRIKSLRSDNESEFMSNDFQRLLCDNSIWHETSAPYSPHQNRTAERNWQPLCEMAKCMDIENNLPKSLWTYAVMIAAVIRNKCFNNHLKQTPYYMKTGRKPDLSKMNIFGSTCYAYKNLTKKGDSKCEKEIFVGYDRNSLAYLVFYPEDNRVLKHRLIKFISNVTNQQTQTYPTDDYFPQKKNVQNKTSAKTPDPQIKTTETQDNAQTEEDSKLRHYPRRERKPPEYLNDYITNSEDDSDHALINFDYCYKATWNIPRYYKEAIDSSDAHSWVKAMHEELESLKENKVFELRNSLEGKKTVGSRWVFTTKENPEGSKRYKARFVAWGFSQKRV